MARKLGKILGIGALVLGLSILGCAQTKTLTILHANDTHSALLPFGHPSVPGPFGWLMAGHGRAALVRESGGIARMATLIKRARMREKNVLALHAGDVFVGSFEFNKYLGYPELKIMESLYDAIALGNHEFDLGLDTLAAIIGGQLGTDGPVNLPLLCANFNFDGHPLAGIVQRSIIREIDGVKIGIFGLGNEDPVNYSQEILPLFSGDVYTAADTQADLLRAAGCEVVICLSHQGRMIDEEVLSQVSGIDIIVGGHSHDLFDKAIVRNGKIIVQAGSHGRYLGELTVDYVVGQGVTLRHWTAWPVDSRTKPDPRIEAQLNKLRSGVVRDPRFGPVYSQIVALVGRDIENDWPATGQYRDTPLGNLVSDAMKKALTHAGYQVDCVLDAMGYTEYGIQAGKVVGNDVMRAVPYGYDPVSGLGFKIVLAPLPPELILGGLEYSTSFVEYTKSLCIQPSGLTFTYDSSKPPAAYLGDISRLDPKSVKIGNEYVAQYLGDPTKYYFVAMSEQVFNFLNNLVGNQLVKIDTGIFEYNAVRDYMRSLRFVVYNSEGRVKDTAAAAIVKPVRR
jgi:2',3'-cyclic-nucleotide 2'-phosphodiesterase (5'-nucleotidase family)